MRYDTPIFFQKVDAGAYDTTTGNYGENIITEEKRYANVTHSGVDTLQLVYGDIRQSGLTVRLQRHYEKAFDRIRIGDKTYHVDFGRSLRNAQVFVVSEVQ